MDFVSPIITPIVESLMVPVKKHLGFWISSSKYVKNMDAKMKQLKDLSREVEDKRDTALANTEVVPERVEPWLKDVEEMNDRAKSIPTGAIGCFNVPKRYKAGKRSFEILKEIEDLETRESKISFTKEKISLAKVGTTSEQPSTSTLVLAGNHSSFSSRDVLFSDALKSVQSNDETHKMIALCGPGGVGKTTLMEQLNKVVEDSKMFDWVVKVVVGENCDVISLQRAIAEYIHEDLSETTKDARANRLRKKFEGMSQQGQKKILVIMDDIWKEVDVKDVGLTSPLPNGFKLLFTSRFEYVCTRMGVNNDSIFRVRVLNNAEAITLFFKILGPSPSYGDDPELQRIGEDIAKKCGGLPIALKTMADNLRGNVKDAWKEALSNLQHDDLQDLSDIVHKVFEISYNNLQREDDKAIFLLSGLFPDDFNIPIEDLMSYGWGLKLFTNVHTLLEARRRTNICVNNLIRANLLTESESTGCVKMHDLMRAFVLSNFAKVKQASILNHDNLSWKRYTKDANESYERILLKCTDMSTFPAGFNFPNLSLLILMDGNKLLKLPEDIYERMQNLEVFSYENMGFSFLPVMFEHSTKLRTLCLRSCALMDDISFFGSLSNLVTLSFAHCSIRRLPATIGKLKKLKLLDLTGCFHLRIDDGVFRNLESLEELYMRASNGRPIRFTYANCDELENLSQRLFALELEFFKNKVQPKNMSFENLKRFRISIGCELSYTEKTSFRNTLNLVTSHDVLRECKIGDLFVETEELHLQVDYIYNLENVMNHHENVSSHHSFSNLRVLHISKCTELKYLFTDDMASDLKNLERLTISECHFMRTLIGNENSRVEVIRLQKLNFMSLKDLPSMVSLCETMIELPEMMELIIDGLPQFTSIYSDDHNNTCAIRSLLNKQVVIPKLEKLDICRMENLNHIWPHEISTTDTVSMLRWIEVRECDSLVNIFPSNPLPLVSNLEELIVAQCGSIEVLFNINFKSVCEMGEYSSSRLRSIRVYHLQKLKELWRIRGENKFDILINGFKGVESIRIEHCKRFTRIFTPTTIKFDLGALTYCSMTDNGKEVDVISEVDGYTPKSTYPSYLLDTIHHVQHLLLHDDERVDVVFEMDSHPSLVVLPLLNALELHGLKVMSHVWKCNNWNRFLIPQHQPLQFPFQNLRDILLGGCPKIKYLFSPLMAKYLSNLGRLIIYFCNGMEEVISRRDDESEENTTSTSSHHNTTLFPHLKSLQLSFMSCLKSIDGGDTNTIHDQSKSIQVSDGCWSLCQYTRTIFIHKCDALSHIIPWYAVGQSKGLEKLDISECKTLMEVFESVPINNNVDEEIAHGGAGIDTTLTRTTLKNITTLVVPQLSNLKIVCISDCDLLPHIFTISTLKSLDQLKELKVERCKAMQVIVKEENETSSEVVVLPRLETLELDDLSNLKAFFLGMNDFRWPLLDNVKISDCPQLMMFTYGQSKTPKLKYINTRLGRHSLECGLNFHGTIEEHQTTFSTSSSSNASILKGIPWSFHNLIEIHINRKDFKTNIIPSKALLQLEKLQQIHLDECYGIKEVFEVVASEGSGFNESHTVVKIPNLTQVNLGRVYNLKYLWKSTQWMTLEFPNLTSMSIHKCNKLEHVFTCSMVGSLVQLRDLHVSGCYYIKVIVKEEQEEEEEGDAKVNDIMLPRLKSLKLEYLENLKGFCSSKKSFSLPLLDMLQIKNSPAIMDFTKGHVSTPELKVIDTTFGMCYVKTDLNSFIKTKQEEGYEF